MTRDQQSGEQQSGEQQSDEQQAGVAQQARPDAAGGQSKEKKAGDDAFDGLKGKKPEELTPEELRLMADTMPGEGPGD